MVDEIHGLIPAFFREPSHSLTDHEGHEEKFKEIFTFPIQLVSLNPLLLPPFLAMELFIFSGGMAQNRD
jgi:hypothetical protein